MTQNQDDLIQRAVAEVILQTSVPAQTTLASDYVANTDYVDLVDGSQMTANGILDWWDGIDEKYQLIDHVDGNRVYLKLRTGQTGLTEAHLAGATVSTNLVRGAPQRIGPMLRKGRTVVLAYVYKATRRKFAGRISDRTVIVRIQLHRSIDAGTNDPALWSLDQQEALHADSQELQITLDNRSKLQDRDGNAKVQGLGEEGRDAPYMSEIWEPLVTDLDIPQAIAAFDLIVRPGTNNQP